MMMRKCLYVFLLCLFLSVNNNAFAQIQVGNDLSEIDYALPREYEIGGIASAEMYAQTGGQAGPQPGADAGQQGGQQGDNIQDADFEEVK